MTMEARGERSPATTRGETSRSSILESAARLFAVKGFEGTSLLDIAEASGLTRPAVYHYFASKHEVLSTLVAETSENTATMLAAVHARTDLDASDKIRAVVHELVRERTAAPERFKMLDRTETAMPADVAAQHLRARRTVLTELTAMIADGIHGGQFRESDERLSALSILGMCNWLAWWYTPERGPAVDVVSDSLAENAVAMLARPEHRLPASPGAHGAIEQLRQDLDYLERLIPRD